MRRKLTLAAILIAACATLFLVLNWIGGRGNAPRIPFAKRHKVASLPPGQVEPKSPAEKLPTVIIEADFPIRDSQTKELAYRVKSDEASIYDDGRVELTRPKIVIYGPGGKETIVEGETGSLKRSAGAGKEAETGIQAGTIEKNVLMRTPDGLTLKTENLRWERELEKMFSEGPVRIESPEFLVTGTDLEVVNGMKTMVIEKDVRVDLQNGTNFVFLGTPSGKTSAPLTVTCEGILEYFMDRREARFKTNVVGRKEESTLRCDDLAIFFQETEKGLEAERFEAIGRVQVERTDHLSTGERLLYSAKDRTATLFGSPATVRQGQNLVEADVLYYDSQGILSTDHPGRFEILGQKGAPSSKDEEVYVTWQGKMRYDLSENRARFEENVKAVEGLSTLTGNFLEILFSKTSPDAASPRPDSNRSRSIERLEARENVSLVEADRTATGERFVYDASRDQTILSAKEGEAQVTRGTDVVRGETLTFEDSRDTLIGKGTGYLKILPKEGEQKETQGQTEIWWSKDMTMDGKANKALFRGDVRVKTEDRIVWADELEVFFSDGGEGARKIRQTIATGHAHSKDSKQESWADRMVSSPDGSADLFGAPARVVESSREISAPTLKFRAEDSSLDAFGPGSLAIRQATGESAQSPEETQVTWKEKMLYREKDLEAEFFGDVVVMRPGITLLARYLQVFFEKGASSEIREAIATGEKSGDVVVIQGSQRGEGTHLLWRPAEGFATLEGDPLATLYQDQNATRARKVTFYEKTGRVSTVGQWSMTFMPGETAGPSPSETPQETP